MHFLKNLSQVMRSDSPDPALAPPERVLPQVLEKWKRGPGHIVEEPPRYISIMQQFPVNVLLDRRQYQAPNALQLAPEDRPPMVVIFGLMKSGTHALRRYVSDFFDCLVEPSGKAEAYPELPPHFSGWKHHTACGAGRLPYVLPERWENRPVVLLCVRDIRSLGVLNKRELIFL